MMALCALIGERGCCNGKGSGAQRARGGGALVQRACAGCGWALFESRCRDGGGAPEDQRVLPRTAPVGHVDPAASHPSRPAMSGKARTSSGCNQPSQPAHATLGGGVGVTISTTLHPQGQPGASDPASSSAHPAHHPERCRP